MELDSKPPESETPQPRLRLVWSNPHPPRPRPRPLDLATAIERHLSGQDGYSDDEFLQLFSGRSGSARP